jgi:hypothetical protein
MTFFRIHSGTHTVCFVIIVLSLCVTAHPVEFAGGTGEPNNPYQIATAEQLRQAIYSPSGNTHHISTTCFILIEDIDCSGLAQGSPADMEFNHTLDGNSHVISNLPVPMTGEPVLFSTIGSFGLIKNLVLDDCYASGCSGAVSGLLCGTNAGRIANCRVTNSTIESSSAGNADEYKAIGGLAAVNQGIIEDCQVDAVLVVCRRPTILAGGLVGRNLGVIRRCGATGSVSAYTGAGGLVGVNRGDIEASWARATVGEAEQAATLGGLVGVNQGRIRDSYAAGTIWGGVPSGGLVGFDESGEISRCYCCGAIVPRYSSEPVARRLVGRADVASIRHSYYLSLEHTTESIGMPGIALSPSQMMRQESFEGWEFGGQDPLHPWLMPEDSFPRLACELQEDIPSVANMGLVDAQRILEEYGWRLGEVRSDYSRSIPTGRIIWTFPSGRAMPGAPIDVVVSLGRFDWALTAADPNVGMEGHPLQIQTAGQLEALIDWTDNLSRHFELVADIDMAGRVLSQPVLGPRKDRRDAGFAGSFQGNGFEIRNFTIRNSETGEMQLGLLGILGQGGTITNLRVTGAEIVGYQPYAVGILAGSNSGTFERCYADGFVYADSPAGLVTGSNWSIIHACESHGCVVGNPVGGLVGRDRGVVERSYSDAWIGAIGYGGGLIGYHEGRLSDSYSCGAVAAQSAVRCGTLVGYSSGEVVNCYATGLVSGVSQDYGCGVQVIGQGDSQITGCYYRMSSTHFPSLAFGTGLSDGQMRQQGDFAGWSFWPGPGDGSDCVWFMPQDGYPLLTWQPEVGDLPVIPQVLGLPADEALSQLQAAGVVTTVRHEYDTRVPRSCVLRVVVDAADRSAVTAELIVSLGPYDWAANPADGSEENPLAVSLASQLVSLGEHPELWDKHFVLTADIDLGWLVLDEALIARDVNTAEPGFQGPMFNGTFDGAGHRLVNLTINGEHDFLGLFGALGPASSVCHLYVDDVQIVGAGETKYIGPIAGIGEGFLEDCHTSGSVRGDSYVGQFVGDMRGTVDGCSSTVESTMSRPRR